MADDKRKQDNLDEETRSEIGSMGDQTRAEEADMNEMGEKGGRSQGKSNKTENFANHPQEEVEDATSKGESE